MFNIKKKTLKLCPIKHNDQRIMVCNKLAMTCVVYLVFSLWGGGGGGRDVLFYL